MCQLDRIVEADELRRIVEGGVYVREGIALKDVPDLIKALPMNPTSNPVHVYWATGELVNDCFDLQSYDRYQYNMYILFIPSKEVEPVGWSPILRVHAKTFSERPGGPNPSLCIER